MRWNLSPNLFRLLRSLSAVILKRLIRPMACSLSALSEAHFVLFLLSSLVSGVFFFFFLGKLVFAGIF